MSKIDKTVQNIKDSNEFKETLRGKSTEELRQIEETIIAEAEAVDKELTDTKIALPKKGYEKVADDIRYFVDKQTVQWQFAQAMKNMYDFWNPKVFNANIDYMMLHQTLTTLGGLQFSGYNEWERVIRINDYFEPVREEYVRLASKPYDIAERHGMVMDALGLTNPVEVQQ